MNDTWRITSETALRWTAQDFTNDKATLVQVMAWCRQTTSYYLDQCRQNNWCYSLMQFFITRQAITRTNANQLCRNMGVTLWGQWVYVILPIFTQCLILVTTERPRVPTSASRSTNKPTAAHVPAMEAWPWRLIIPRVEVRPKLHYCDVINVVSHHQ